MELVIIALSILLTLGAGAWPSEEEAEESSSCSKRAGGSRALGSGGPRVAAASREGGRKGEKEDAEVPVSGGKRLGGRSVAAD